MKRIFFFWLLPFAVSLHAQSLIAVEHNGVSAFYTTFDDAYNAAQNGDNIYLPGGGFTVSNPIAKSLHIYGAGYNQDSSVATGITALNSITLMPGCDNGSIEGIYFNPPSSFNIASLNFGDGGSTLISNYTISYCALNAGLSFNNPSTNITIRDNSIGGFSTGGSIYYSTSGNLSTSLITNNIIAAQQVSLTSNSNLMFSNNIFFYAAPFYYLQLANNSTYQNNIFQNNSTQVNNSFFYNNINAFPSGSNNFNYGNIPETWDLTFVNPGVSGNGFYYYNVHNDYHLKTTSAGHNAGTDGTDIGIYGGLFPWKDGSMPSNPHIISKSISGTTDANGNINVNIKVEAEKN